jgi:hypothetical protein
MFSLREFTIDEDAQVRKGLLTDGLELETELDMSTLDSSVRQLISEGVQASATIDPQLLISIYDGIQL